ncbi:MAG: phosphate/phosphite/phosphonate ABC transporter substrate-binding protein [Candidatus Omnitrophica bacterium]|nr:phosphate/phosphite/phosphonate ABC transporter substrate-binding protein [Candidatus Omnitrophota bacterium]
MIKQKILATYFLALFVFVFTGCGNKEEAKKVDLSKVEEIKNLPQEPLTLRIGLIPEQDIRKMAARYEPLAKYLSKKLNLKVILVYLDNYAEVCDKFIYKQLDAAFFGSFSYVLTKARAQVEPIARPDYQGISTYRGMILVRRGSNISNVAQMKGKRLALVHQATFAGYLFPLFYFQEHGVKDLKGYFSQVIFCGGHDSAIFALLKGQADIATPKDLVYQRLIKENPDLEKKLEVLTVSEPVPSNAFCVSGDLDPGLKGKLKDILINLHKDPNSLPILESLGGVTKFIETKDEDYRPLYETIRILGIDLNTYPYYERPDMGFKRSADVQEAK